MALLDGAAEQPLSVAVRGRAGLYFCSGLRLRDQLVLDWLTRDA